MARRKIKVSRVCITKHALRTLIIDREYCNRFDDRQYSVVLDRLDNYQSVGLEELQDLAELIVDGTEFHDVLPWEGRDDHVREVMTYLSSIAFVIFE